MTMRRLLIACVGSIALALCVPAGAGAELKSIWGPNELPNGHSAFPTYRKLGVDILQRQLVWAQVARTRPSHPRDPHDPAYRWPADVDGAALESRRHGMHLALMIKGTPRWANGRQDTAWVPRHLRDYANFAIAAARHYRRVHLWMVWGEPMRPGNFHPVYTYRSGIETYARLLDRAYGALKSVRRSNTVIGGGSFDGQHPTIPRFVRWLRLPNGKPPRLDWYMHNPYGVRYPRLSNHTYSPIVRDMSDVDTLVRDVRRRWATIHRRPKLWLSEFNVQSDHPSRAFSFYVSRHEQARWLTAAYRIAHRERYVAGLGWFGLADQPEGTDLSLSGGLLTAGGHRKPAWYAYRRAR